MRTLEIALGKEIAASQDLALGNITPHCSVENLSFLLLNHGEMMGRGARARDQAHTK